MNRNDEFLFKLEDIDSIEFTDEYVNMVDIQVEEDSSFILANGVVSHNSALSGLMPILGRKHFGYFPLRGKSLNVHGTPMSKIVANEELKNIMTILELDVSKNITDMTYENVLISSDADLDGAVIRGLVLTFFYRFTPELIKQGRIKFLNTPIMYTKGKDGLPDNWIYDMKESSKLKGHVYYSKGLGSWKKQDLKHIIEVDGLDNMIKTFEYDENTAKSIDLWMGDDSDLRKGELNGLSFFYDAI